MTHKIINTLQHNDQQFLPEPQSSSHMHKELPNIMDDDEDSALDLSEQLNRPPDVAFHQQRIPAWHPILDPTWVILALFYLAAIMIPVGFKFDSIQNNVVELKVTYDGEENPLCGIGLEYNMNRTCNITFVAPKYMQPPVLVHYGLTNFHQNHNNYYNSRDEYQLRGQVGNQDAISAENCEPLNKLGNITLNPCGLIANTLFNDYFQLISGRDVNGDPLVMLESGIAWESDLQYTFKQPDGFTYEVCPSNVGCTDACCNGTNWSCEKPYVDRNGTCYRYYYPEDETTQYLYETYPDIISPLEGVTNEHFVVWMRVATQENFRKLYGWIDQGIAAGEKITFSVNANFVVERFRGSKILILGTTSIIGGKNPYIAPLFWGTGFFALGAALIFSLKQLIRPRRLADRAYLHYKED